MRREAHNLLRRQDIHKGQAREGQAAGVRARGYGRLPAEGLLWSILPGWRAGFREVDRQEGVVRAG